MLIGSHVSPEDPLAAAEAEGADAVQIFLGNPQSWKAPKPRADAARLRESPLPIYVHAPYLINVASPNNRVRIPSRKILQQTCDAAADIAATAVIVHGGHITADDDDLQAGFLRGAKRWSNSRPRSPSTWRTPPAATTRSPASSTPSPASGTTSATRASAFACHAWAAGEELIDAVARIKSITGRIDLVHCNDSKDPQGSGRDRHANLGTGEIDVDLLVAAVMAAGAPVICETADQGRKDDIALLRDRTARQ